MTLASTTNASFMIDGFGQGSAATDIRAIGWLAPRDCSLEATLTVVGGVTNANPSLGIALRFTRWTTAGSILGSSQSIAITPSTPSGTSTSLTMSVTAGQLLTFSQIAQAGTTVTANTKAYLTSICR